MRIELDRVREKPFRWDEMKDVPAALLERSDLIDLGQVTWRGEVTHDPPGFELRAHLAYRQTLSCIRCLQSVQRAVDTDVALRVLVGAAEPMTGEHELEESELDLLFLEEEELETDAILLEQIQLEIPMRVLCREDCAGLCPACGADRNREPCDCLAEPVDPRWTALAALRGPGDTGGE